MQTDTHDLYGELLVAVREHLDALDEFMDKPGDEFFKWNERRTRVRLTAKRLRMRLHVDDGVTPVEVTPYDGMR